MAKLKNDIIGTAGVHLVCFKLALRGVIVLPILAILSAGCATDYKSQSFRGGDLLP
jgi:hypothetical protein